MNPLKRLCIELAQVGGHVSAADFARYGAALLTELPAIIRRRTLVPADSRMTGDVGFTVNGQRILVPLGRIGALLAGHDDTPTFGGMREMYASNVYLRPFRKGLKLETAVDLGSNRGLFALMAVKAYGARIAVGVEPSPYFVPVLEALRQANGLTEAQLPREVAFIASADDARSLSMETLMQRYGLDHIDFVKCDIEGGEYDMLIKNNGFLGKVSNLAMEMHPDAGPCRLIVEALTEKGFKVLTTDQFGASVGPERPNYLYASRTGDLAA